MAIRMVRGRTPNEKNYSNYHEKRSFMLTNSLQSLQSKWDRASRWYDLGTMALEAFVFRRLRSRLLKSAAGRVLEVAAGSGLNMVHYPRHLDVTAVDLSPGMLLRARNRGARKVVVMEPNTSRSKTAHSTLSSLLLLPAPFRTP